MLRFPHLNRLCRVSHLHYYFEKKTEENRDVVKKQERLTDPSPSNQGIVVLEEVEDQNH